MYFLRHESKTNGWPDNLNMQVKEGQINKVECAYDSGKTFA